MAEADAPLILVDGDDPVLVSEAVDSVVRAVIGEADWAQAVEDHRGETVSLAAVAEGCSTPSLLADRRVVVVRDVGRFKVDELAPLLAYLENPIPATLLVLAAGEGTTPAKLLAAAKAKGRVVSTRLVGKAGDAWMRDRVAQASVDLDRSAQNLIKEHLGEDLGRVGALLEMLESAYGKGARLGRADVEPYLGQAGSVTPWVFTDAIDGGLTEVAIAAMRRLLESGRHPLVVHTIVARHVQDLLRLDAPGIRTEAQAASALGFAKGRNTFPAKKALGVAKRWGSRAIAEAIGLVAAAELDLKGASAWPPEVVLEVLVARLCRLARTAR